MLPSSRDLTKPRKENDIGKPTRDAQTQAYLSSPKYTRAYTQLDNVTQEVHIQKTAHMTSYAHKLEIHNFHVHRTSPLLEIFSLPPLSNSNISCKAVPKHFSNTFETSSVLFGRKLKSINSNTHREEKQPCAGIRQSRYAKRRHRK